MVEWHHVLGRDARSAKPGKYPLTYALACSLTHLRELHHELQRGLPREGGLALGVVQVWRHVRLEERLEVALHELRDNDVVLLWLHVRIRVRVSVQGT